MSEKNLAEKMDKAAETAEAANRLTQSQWTSKNEIEQAEQDADEAYGQVIDELYGNE